jgi:hypothetical protein
MADAPALTPSSSELPARPASAAGDTGPLSVESSPTSTVPARVHVGRTGIAPRIPPRVTPPKDSKVYRTVLATIALRAQGVKPDEIAKQLGHSADTLRQYMSRAYKAGWVSIASFTDVDDQIEHIIRHRIVENVQTVLSERTDDGKLTAGAREMTIEAAKGFGMFKTHAVQKTEGTSQVGFALKVQVEMPPDTGRRSPVMVRPGTIGGHASLEIPVDAEVVNQEPEEEEEVHG